MILDCPSFKVSLDLCKHVLMTERAKRDPVRTCAELSVGSMIPVAAVYLYASLENVLGALPELLEAHDRCVKFYQYEHVVDFDGTIRHI